MTDDGFRFVHLTDTHIMAGGTWRIRGGDVEFDTDASLRRVVEVVRALDPAPAFAVLGGDLASPDILRSEEHTSELQSHSDLVCRLLLEKKNHQCTRRVVLLSLPGVAAGQAARLKSSICSL